MKKNIIHTILPVFIFFLAGNLSVINGQDNRALDTKVVDVLAQVPVQDEVHLNQMLYEVIQMGEEGILALSKRLVPLGSGNDTEARYVLHSLATYAGSPDIGINSKNMVEASFLKALEQAEDNEIKTFLIRRLAFFGSDDSVEKLSPYLSDANLFRPALASMTSIGTENAGREILKAVNSDVEDVRRSCIRSLGDLRFQPAVETLHEVSDEYDHETVRFSLFALAEIADPISHKVLFKAAKSAEFKANDTEAVIAYVNYGSRLLEVKDSTLATKVGNNLLKYCTAEDQLQFRAAGIQLLSQTIGAGLNDLLLMEVEHKDAAYRGAVLAAIPQPINNDDINSWIAAVNKATEEAKPQLINTIGKIDHLSVFDDCLVPSLKHQNELVRLSGIKMMAYQDKSKSLERLLEKLEGRNTEAELQAIEETLLKICGKEDHELLAVKLLQMQPESQAVVVRVLGARAATEQFETISELDLKGNGTLDQAIFAAMGTMARSNNLPRLFELLETTEGEKDIEALQHAIISVIDRSDTNHEKEVLSTYDSSAEKYKIIPVLVSLESEEALKRVTYMLSNGTEKERVTALKALSAWRNNEAIPYLYYALKNTSDPIYRTAVFQAYLNQVSASDHPDDQKLLLIRRVSNSDNSPEEKKSILRACRGIQTFMSLVFVSDYLMDEKVKSLASGTAIAIALPTPTFEGLSGEVVRDIVSRSIENLSGQDSQYLKIDVREFLENMPKEKGYLPIFNGKDLSGWQGLVGDPLKRSELSEKELNGKQAEADAQMERDWVVDNGLLTFKGEGFNNICTIKKYGNFELLLDWKIEKDGDSGIYLRGTPQVQIWDTSLIEEGAEVGSGGLYNNKTHPNKPVLVADNPVTEWNTFRIRMVGDRVTVYLNGQLVTDAVTLENFWNRELPIFDREGIELQAHGEPVWFRNIFVKELSHEKALMDEAEMAEGFVSLFNGKDLAQWTGNKKDFQVVNGELIVKPENGEHGNLYSIKEYSDFVIRFDFQLTPGANNGFGFHTPLEGDAAYMGKESQILDNTAEIYSNIKPYQAHASIYGVLAAKKGYLSPVGEWNEQEIEVRGDDIKITLNGTVVLQGNLKDAAKDGTRDGKDHPGLKRHKGYIAFLGHGSDLKFRNIRIKDLSDN